MDGEKKECGELAGRQLVQIRGKVHTGICPGGGGKENQLSLGVIDQRPIYQGREKIVKGVTVEIRTVASENLVWDGRRGGKKEGRLAGRCRTLGVYEKKECRGLRDHEGPTEYR
jgi:hypothetical protein